MSEIAVSKSFLSLQTVFLSLLRTFIIQECQSRCIFVADIQLLTVARTVRCGSRRGTSVHARVKQRATLLLIDCQGYSIVVVARRADTFFQHPWLGA
jgi:hypothetical protein